MVVHSMATNLDSLMMMMMSTTTTIGNGDIRQKAHPIHPTRLTATNTAATTAAPPTTMKPMVESNKNSKKACHHQQRRVRFSGEVRALPPDPRYALTPEVRREAFYRHDEFIHMYREAQIAVQMHAYYRYKDAKWDDDSGSAQYGSIRGAEGELQRELRLRSIQRHVDAVLDEQDRLLAAVAPSGGGRTGYDGEVSRKLCDVSSRMSRPHRSHAAAMAKLDAASAGYREERKMLPLLNLVRGAVSSWFSERTE